MLRKMNTLKLLATVFEIVSLPLKLEMALVYKPEKHSAEDPSRDNYFRQTFISLLNYFVPSTPEEIIRTLFYLEG